MRYINVDKLKIIRKKLKPKDDELKFLRKTYLDTNSNMWEEIFELDHKISSLYVESLNHFLLDRYKEPIANPQVGEIYMANLMLGYNGESSLIHPVLILEVIGGRVFVVPGSSSDDYTKDAFHWLDNNDIDKTNKVLIKPSESETENGSSLHTDTGFKLDNAGLISSVRLTEKTPVGFIKTNSVTYLTIKDKLFESMFEKHNILLFNEMNKNRKLKRILFKLKNKKLVRKNSNLKLFYLFS